MRVQVPPPLPFTISIGLLAQLAERRTFNPQVLGSNPRQPTITEYCPLAQLVEQVTVNHLVRGSSPRGAAFADIAQW
jgi:hypothetical protein